MRVISVAFGEGKTFDYKTTLDVQKGDFVVVEARGSFSVARVVDVDRKSDYPEDKLKWAFQKVDMGLLDLARGSEPRLAG